MSQTAAKERRDGPGEIPLQYFPSRLFSSGLPATSIFVSPPRNCNRRFDPVVEKFEFHICCKRTKKDKPRIAWIVRSLIHTRSCKISARIREARGSNALTPAATGWIKFAVFPFFFFKAQVQCYQSWNSAGRTHRLYFEVQIEWELFCSGNIDFHFNLRDAHARSIPGASW